MGRTFSLVANNVKLVKFCFWDSIIQFELGEFLVGFFCANSSAFGCETELSYCVIGILVLLVSGDF